MMVDISLLCSLFLDREIKRERLWACEVDNTCITNQTQLDHYDGMISW